MKDDIMLICVGGGRRVAWRAPLMFVSGGAPVTVCREVNLRPKLFKPESRGKGSNPTWHASRCALLRGSQPGTTLSVTRVDSHTS